jgi:hypothetical protein
MKFILRSVICLIFPACLSAPAQTLPPVKTVFVLMMENMSWSRIRTSTNAPYINTVLLPQASYCDQYYTPSNFTASLLSYLWLEAGSTFGLTSADTNCYSPPAIWSVDETNHLSTLLFNAGVSWKSYQECIGGDVVPLENTGCYVVRHNPFVYFHDATGTNDPHFAYGVAHNRPYSEFAADLTNNAVARYNFITPGRCSNMHDSCVPLSDPMLQGDTWLSSEIPKIMASRAYQDNGALFIIWDDSGLANTPSGMILLSPLAKGGGYASTNRYTHSDALRTFQDILGIRPYLGGAADARNLAELFGDPGELRFGAVELNGPTGLSLTAYGASPDALLTLETSTNLVDWGPVQTNGPGQTTFDVDIPSGPHDSPLFFRLYAPGN